MSSTSAPPSARGSALLQFSGAIGRALWSHWSEIIYATAVLGTAVSFIVRPHFWTRDVRKLFARQVMAMGMEPLLFVCSIAALVGISVIVQLSYWAGQSGQSQLLGPALVTIVARELAPVLINFVVIVRSGSAMATELGVMKLNGEVDAMEAQGRDPFVEIVVPRVLGIAVSTFCLTVVFIITALLSGFVFAALLGKGSSDLFLFADSISRAIQFNEVINILGKSILPALFAGVSCCIGGLGVTGSVKAIPLATQRALTRSIAGLFIICSAISFLAYL
jgi:phospholipid/cholesterol/gamma-HCH transport system permease protein